MEEVDFGKTYVHNDTEIKLTGRVAEKSIAPVGRKKEPRIINLYEIQPADPEAVKWLKWVRFVDLYEIKAK